MGKSELKAESKKIVRRPCSKVNITWTDPFIDVSIQEENNDENRISYPILSADTVIETPRKFISTNTGKTFGTDYYLCPSDLTEARRNEMGWWGRTNSAVTTGSFSTTIPTIDITFIPRLVIGWLVVGDTALNEYPVDFDVSVLMDINGNLFEIDIIEIRNNDQVELSGLFISPHFNATGIRLKIRKWSRPLSVVKIAEFYTSYSKTYYDDEIVTMNLLEEFESSKGTLPIGNISCNECELRLQNIDDKFFPENTNSAIRNFVRRNRKIEPYYGFEYIDGTREYIQKGLYWSGDWSMSDSGTDAQTSARDRFELLRNMVFDNSDMAESQININLYNFTVYVLEKLKDLMPDLYYEIDAGISTHIVPVMLKEFFKDKTYYEILLMICQATLTYAYMDLPKESEVELYGVYVKDVLRITKYQNIFNTRTFNDEDIEEYTKKDYIDKTQEANTESLANTVIVKYKVFTEDEETDGEYNDEEFTFKKSDEDSIREYGEQLYTYDASELTQTEEQAEEIADSLIESFATPKRDITINSFGDPTLTLGEIIKFPEYQKNGVNNLGYFAIKKINTQYDGSFRAVIEGRKLRRETPIVYEVYQHTDDAELIWQLTDSGDEIYQANGL